MNFRQSLYDFPCPVSLGEKTPSFGLHRYKEGLNFLPIDDEGFTLRGDRRRLLYKGRRRSHRFSILGDTAFEYDCILHKEPDTNVIILLMEGAEKYDFFRQPNFLCDPFLKGSYAVYKKTILMGEGTGKLCHIHRPLIIDALGRRVWGELAVVGNELRITIPEKWLSMAKYPVVVDPTVGTTTVGSLNKNEDGYAFSFDSLIAVNRFNISQAINGTCTASFYTDNDDTDAGGRPILYSDNGNKPQTRKSTNEGFVNLRVMSNKPKGWREATFKSNGSIASGSYVWFGLFAEYMWYPRFDYAARCYYGYWDDVDIIPNTFPSSPYFHDDCKLSMYFNYTTSQSFTRTLTQGVKLTDGRQLKAEYQRNAIQNASINSLLSGVASLCRSIQETVQGIDDFILTMFHIRLLHETLSFSDLLPCIFGYYRGLIDNAETEASVKTGWVFFTKIIDTVHAAGALLRGLFLFSHIITQVFMRDYLLRRFLVAREEMKLKSSITRDLILESNID
jgi:hypothetical protein